MGTLGYASKITEGFIASGETVVGVCCRNDAGLDTWPARLVRGAKRRIRATVVGLGAYDKPLFVYKRPFEKLSSPAKIASRHKIPVLDPRELRTAGFEATLAGLTPDIVLVAGFRRLIPPNIIKVPRKAIINFHPSLLPKHRGGTPSRWVIRHGQRETGVTAHFVNEEYDCGDIVVQEALSVGADETYGDLELRLSDLAVTLAHRVVEMAKRGTLVGVPQPHQLASKEPSYKGHFQDIQWHLSAREARQTCYAIRPQSGGMTTFGSRPICVWDLDVCEGASNASPPGTVTEIDDQGHLVVSCGTGTAKITSFLHSGTVVPARKLVRRFGIDVGSVFG